MKHWIVLINLLFSFCLTTSAQTRIIGSVKDSTGTAIQSANISYKVDGTIVKTVKTDAWGNFTIVLSTPMQRKSILEIRSVGNSPFLFSITSNRARYDAILKPASINLNEVNIRNKAEIKIKGDTTNYRTKDFSAFQDRSIGDVLKKVPGIEVDEKGKIKINNRAISNLYIDGDNLLDDRYNIGTKAIPYNAISRIQIIEKDQPIKILQENNLSDNVAINLVTDSAFQTKVLGNVAGTLGVPERYNFRGDGMLFRRKLKYLNSLGVTNIGADLSQDIIGHNSATDLARVDRSELAQQLSLGMSSKPAILRNSYAIGSSLLGNINAFQRLSTDKVLRYNFYYFNDLQKQLQELATAYYLGNSAIMYTESQQSRMIRQEAFLKLVYTDNSDKHYLSNDLTLKITPASGTSNLFLPQFSADQLLKLRGNTLINQLSYLKKIASGRIFNFNSYLEVNQRKEMLYISPDLNEAFLNGSAIYEAMNQQVLLPLAFTNNYIDYKTGTRKLFQSYKAGFLAESSSFQSDLSHSGSMGADSRRFQNDVDWKRLKTYIDASLTYDDGKLKVNLIAPVSMNTIRYTGQLQSFNRLFFSPGISIRSKFNDQHQVTFRYAFTQRPGQIDDLYSNYVLQNYRVIAANSTSLSLTSSSDFSASYNVKDASKLLFVTFLLGYNANSSNLISSYQLDSIFQTRLLLPYRNVFSNLNGSIKIGRYFTGLNTNLNSTFGYNFQKGQQFQNGTLIEYNRTIYSINLRIDTKVNSKINLSYVVMGSALNTQTIQKLITIPQVYQVNQIGEINLKIRKNWALSYNANHIYNRQQNSGRMSYLFMDSKIKFSYLKLHTDFELGVNNISNINYYESYSGSMNVLNYSSYKILGRFFIVGATFSL